MLVHDEDGVTLLTRAVEVLLAEDPAALAPGAALTRARAILIGLERLHAAGLGAVADVDSRELFALDGCASTRGWLKTQPCGDHGQLAAARRLRARPHVRDALAAGTVATGQAAQLCAALTHVDAFEAPDHRGEATPIGEDQVIGLLVHGLAPLLNDWTGAQLESVDVTETHLRRRELAGRVLSNVANDGAVATADRLEPAFVLLAEALPSSRLADALGTLVDALRPEQLDAEAEQQQVETCWSLTRRPDGGWDLRAVLDDVTGARLDAEVRARTTAARKHAERVAAAAAEAEAIRRRAEETAGRARAGADAAASPDAEPPADADPVADASATDQGDGDAFVEAPPAYGHDHHDDVLPFPGRLLDELFGQVGAGPPEQPPAREGPTEGDRSRTAAQSAVDALAMLLDDLTGVAPGSGAPAAAQLTVVLRSPGEPGAPPAVLETALGPIRLAPGVARGLGCGGDWSTVTLDDSDTPVGASGTHRHATRRERRAMRARWGSLCAVNGCTKPGPVPHHVEPFALFGRTRLADLVPICTGHHRDVHEGRCTLRLRDGRLIDDRGWADALPRAA